MDKYRNSLKERRESEHAREFRAEEPAPSDATLHGTQQAHYSEAKAPRTAERPNAGSESMHFHTNDYSMSAMLMIVLPMLFAYCIV